MIERVLMEYIANALWQIPLLAGGAWLLLWMVRARVQVQHWVWLGVLGTAVALPLHGMGAGGVTMVKAQSVAVERAAPAEAEGMRVEWTPRLHSVHLAAAAAYWIVALYGSAMLLGMRRIARAWRAARRLVEGSREVALCARDAKCFEEVGRRLGVSLPRIRASEEVKSPMIVGVTAPVLLLPAGFGGFTEDEVRAVLCHELAHVKRRDYLVNVVCQVVALPVVWHPAVQGVQRRIRRTREMVCDAVAAREMESEIGYAKCLLALARGMVGRGELEAQATGLFGDNMLEERVMRLMETKTGMRVRAKAARAASGVTAMIAAAALAAMFHVVPTMAEVQAATLPGTAQSAVAASQGEAKAAPQSEAVQAAPKGVPAHRRKSEAGRASAVKSEKWEGLTPQEQLDIKKAVAEAEEQVKQATVHLNSPEFKKQIADAQRQATEAVAKVNSPEFKKQIADAQRQATEAAAKVNSPEFKRQMAEMQRQVAEATAKMNGPEFKKQMADAQRQAAEAAAKINSPEFRQKMAEAQEKMREAMREFQDAQPQGGDEPMKVK